MAYLWGRTDKSEGPNNRGSTISDCVKQLVEGISGILSLENILEATASILDDDEDENELEDELLHQCGGRRQGSVNRHGDKSQSNSQTEEKPSESDQSSETSASTESAPDHNPTGCVTVTNNQNLLAGTVAVQQLILAQEGREGVRKDTGEVRNDNSPQTPSPDTVTSITSDNTEKEDDDLTFMSDAREQHKEEAPPTQSNVLDKEIPTTCLEISTVQLQTATPAAGLDHNSDLPQENILHATTSPDSTQQEVANQRMQSSVLQSELDEGSTTCLLPDRDDVKKNDPCRRCPLTLNSSTPNTNSGVESEKLQPREVNILSEPQVMEPVLEGDAGSSHLQTYTEPAHTETDSQTILSSSPASQPSTRDRSQDQHDSPASEPEGGTAPPALLERADGEATSPEDSRGTPGVEQPVLTEPEPHSQESPAQPAAILSQDQWSGDQSAAASQPPASEPVTLPAASLHVMPESTLSGLTATDFAAVGQEVTTMEQKGEAASSADEPSTDAPQVNGGEEPVQQPITEQHDHPAQEEERNNKKEAELESEGKENSDESGEDTQEENKALSSQGSQVLEETASSDSQAGRTKYNTVSYRKIKKGNTKQRIDEFESMMNV